MIFGAMNSPLVELAREIKLLSGLGFDYLEMCLDPPLSDPAALKPGEVKKMAEDAGLPIIVGHLPTFVWLADIYPGVREASVNEVRKALNFLAEMEVKKAVLHPGYWTGLVTSLPELGLDLAEESLVKILDAARPLGIVVCLENMFPRTGHMYRPEEFTAVLAAHPDLMMTLDLAHANIEGPRDRVRKMLEAGGDRIRHVHASDNRGREDEHLPLGVGRLDLSGALAGLKRIGYDGSMTLEVFSPDRAYLKRSLKKIKSMWEND
ncbi:MAG: sugar phosphate isomerase/epimerase family protein [Pseudomonadota bacterium]